MNGGLFMCGGSDLVGNARLRDYVTSVNTKSGAYGCVGLAVTVSVGNFTKPSTSHHGLWLVLNGNRHLEPHRVC